ncbi:hypothetical protein GGR57DRAFT_463472 [Xylariaceae sp. FL1272]|nr:hypothetical protein GGR57DRAFT_463472 [Xylariaceae sp. FL1272]
MASFEGLDFIFVPLFSSLSQCRSDAAMHPTENRGKFNYLVCTHLTQLILFTLSPFYFISTRNYRTEPLRHPSRL